MGLAPLDQQPGRYHLLKDETPYQDSGAAAYEQKAKERDLAHLRKKAAKLGYTLTASV